MPKKSKEEQRLYNKKYYQKNKTAILADQKTSYEEKKKLITPETRLKNAIRQRQYYQENKEYISERNKIYQKEWYQNNKDLIVQRSKEYRLKRLGTLEYRFRRAIQTAKQRGISFSLTFEQFYEVVVQPCYYCEFKLCEQVKEGSGIDRIDSSKGYEIGNVISCGHRCNSLKNDDLTMEEAKAAIQAILNVRVIKQYENDIKQKLTANSSGDQSGTQGQAI